MAVPSQATEDEKLSDPWSALTSYLLENTGAASGLKNKLAWVIMFAKMSII